MKKDDYEQLIENQKVITTFEIDLESSTNNILESDLFKVINLKINKSKKTFKTSTVVRIPITTTQTESLQAIGLNLDSVLIDVVVGETLSKLNKEIITSVSKLASNNIEIIDLTKLEAGAAIFEVQTNIVNTIEDNTLKNSDDSFIITNTQIGAMLTNSYKFKESPFKEGNFATLFELGSLKFKNKSVKVFVNPIFKWNETNILIGNLDNNFYLDIYNILGLKIDTNGGFLNEFNLKINKNKFINTFMKIEINTGDLNLL